MADSSEFPQPRRRWSIFRIIVVGTVLAVSGFFAVGVWMLFGPRTPGIPIGRETTFLTEPVDADGYIDYSAVLVSAEVVDPSENAAQLYLRAAGKSLGGVRPADAWQEALSQLEVEPEFDPDLQLADFLAFAAEQNGELPDAVQSEATLETLNADLSRCTSAPWTREDFPLVAEWLAANEKPIQLILEGTDRPSFAFRPEHDGVLLDYLLPLAQELRTFARVLSVRAMHQVGEGDHAGAAETVEAMHRLARQTNRPAFIIEVLVGLAIEAVACSTEHALIAQLESVEAVRQHREMIAQRSPAEGLLDAINMTERCAALEMIQEIDREANGFAPKGMGRALFPAGLPALARRFLIRTIDTERVSRAVNNNFDELIDAIQQPLPERAVSLQTLEKRYAAPAGSPVAMGQNMEAIFGGMLMQPLLKSDGAYRRQLSQTKLLDVACAVRLFELENDRPAKERSDLVPKYLAEWPASDHDGKPFEDATFDGRWMIFFRTEGFENKLPAEIELPMRIDIPYSQEPASVE